MSLQRKISFQTAVAIFVMSVLFSSALFAKDTTIVGEVDDQSQIVASDGEIYMVVNNDVGLQIVTEHISEIIRATGTVEYSEEDGMMTITAKHFEVMDSDYAEEPDNGDEYEE